MLSPSSPGPKRLNKYECNHHGARTGTHQKKNIRPFRRKREGSTLSTDCHEPKVNHSSIGHRETNSTAKNAPCEPSHQEKAGFPHGTQQRTKVWSCLNHNLDMRTPGLRKNSRTTRPRDSEQKKCGRRPGKEPHETSC